MARPKDVIQKELFGIRLEKVRIEELNHIIKDYYPRLANRSDAVRFAVAFTYGVIIEGKPLNKAKEAAEKAIFGV